MELKRLKSKLKDNDSDYNVLTSIAEVAKTSRRRSPSRSPSKEIAIVPQLLIEDKDQETTRLAHRLSAAQDRLAKLTRIEKAIADFHEEVLNSLSDPNTIDDTMYRRVASTGDGDTLALINSLRTHVRIQRGFKDDYEKTLKMSLKSATVAQRLEESHTQDELKKLTKAHEALKLERDILIVQMEEAEHGRAIVVQEGLKAVERERSIIEQLHEQLDEAKITSDKLREQVEWQTQVLDEKQNELNALTYEVAGLRHKVSDYEGGGSRRKLSTVCSATSISPPKQLTNKCQAMETRECNLKISHLEANAAVDKEKIMQLEQKLSKPKKKLREREERKDEQIVALEAALLKSKGRLREKEERLTALKSEYDKIFTALQNESKDKQTNNNNNHTIKPTNDEVNRIANDNQYVTEYYKTRYEHQASEILTLRKQIKKLLSAEHKQYFDQCLRSKAHNRLQQQFQQLKHKFNEVSNQSSTSHISTDPHGFLTASEFLSNDIDKLLARHEFLESFYRDHLKNSKVTTINITMEKPPPPILRSASTSSVLDVVQKSRPKSAGIVKPKGIGFTKQSFRVGALFYDHCFDLWYKDVFLQNKSKGKLGCEDLYKEYAACMTEELKADTSLVQSIRAEMNSSHSVNWIGKDLPNNTKEKDTCTASDLMPVFLPIITNANAIACQKDSDVTFSLTGNAPSKDQLTVVASKDSCTKLFTDIQNAVNGANVTCTINGGSVSAFVGTSISTFLTNLSLYFSTTTAPPTTSKPSSSILAMPS
ncbi:hypothetical protein THRCLA_04206, partial [Thraustotheca clavata]